MTFEKSKKGYYDKEYSFSDVLNRLWLYARDEKRRLLLVLVLFLFNTTIAIIVPLLLQVAIDELGNPIPDFREISLAGWLYLLGTVISWIAFYLIIRAEWSIIAKTVTQLRMDMFIKLQEHDLSFYDKNKTGRIMSRVVNDAWELGNFLLIFVEVASNSATIVGMALIMLSINPMLTLIMLVIFPIIFIIILIIGFFLIKFNRETRKTVGAVNGATQESIAGIMISKSFAREARNKDEFIELNKDNLRANIKRSLTFSTIFPLFDFISSLVVFLIVYAGGYFVINGEISPGELWVFYSYSLQLIGPIINFSQQLMSFQSGRAAAERIFSLLEVPSAMIKGEASPSNVKGNIEFKNLTFSYSEDTKLFNDFNLVIPEGQNIALVGHTGSGKTSVVSLLARFYEFTEGDILLDGVSVRGYDPDEYRRSLGIVLQDPYLFSGNIRENIEYGISNGKLTEEALIDAITATHVKDFVDFLPEGLETQVGERGSLLSLGQRQLISFARALVANPKILVLDEATASVDAYTESLIQDSIEQLFKNRTSIVVAHRLSTIIGADRILVFDHGQIVGDGTHDELLKTNLTYQNLYKTYYEFQGIF